MSSTSIMTSAPPSLDVQVLAKTTRKTLERIAPFCQMSSPSSDSSTTSSSIAAITKIVNRMQLYIRAINSSVLASQCAFHLASDAMILYDTVVAQKGWDTDISADSLRKLAAQGCDHAQRTREVVRDVHQDMYKIAAYTKDNYDIVLVHPDPSHSATLRKPLKEVGADLVANLSLLTQFSALAAQHALWWEWAKDQISLSTAYTENSTLLPPIKSSGDVSTFLRWENIKSDYQMYYNVMSLVQEQYPGFLSKSAIAWQRVTSEEKASTDTVAQSIPNSNAQSPAGSAAHSPSASSVTVASHAGGKQTREGRPIGVKTLLGKLRSSSLDLRRGNKEKDDKKFESDKAPRSSSRQSKQSRFRRLCCGEMSDS